MLRVLSDIFSVFVQVAESNRVMNGIFKEEATVINVITGFNEVVMQSSKLEGHFDNSNEKEKIVRENIYPAFLTWKSTMQKGLQPYILN